MLIVCFWSKKTLSATIVQRRFLTQYGKDPPSRQQFILSTKHFGRTDCSVSHSKRTSRPCTAEAVVEHVKNSFVRSPRK
ncbi:hypothetical protein C0J52_26614 [Blattella germanica]|nr:hypothetical protein C0J52_26614 [Blattella germanica]